MSERCGFDGEACYIDQCNVQERSLRDLNNICRLLR